MKEVTLKCSCGGTTTVKIDPDVNQAIGECACGKVLFWSDGNSTESPPTLGIFVSDAIDIKEKIS